MRGDTTTMHLQLEINNKFSTTIKEHLKRQLFTPFAYSSQVLLSTGFHHNTLQGFQPTEGDDWPELTELAIDKRTFLAS